MRDFLNCCSALLVVASGVVLSHNGDAAIVLALLAIWLRLPWNRYDL